MVSQGTLDDITNELIAETTAVEINPIVSIQTTETAEIPQNIATSDTLTDVNMWASYQLGRLYLFGTDGLKKEKEKAMQFFNLSAEQGNDYAQNIPDNQEKFENEMLASTVFSLFVNLSRCIEDDYHNKFQSGKK